MKKNMRGMEKKYRKKKHVKKATILYPHVLNYS
jgi:hypothetical protein